MNFLYAISINHKNASLDDIGLLHIEPGEQTFLSDLKHTFCLDELMFLSTCNRVEYYIVTEKSQDYKTLFPKILKYAKPKLSSRSINRIAENAVFFESHDVAAHLFNVASSLDAMVIGEREIITQVRKAYENCHSSGLTGDRLRLTVNAAIKAAKQVYTQTAIAEKPVSVVSLAHRKVSALKLDKKAKVMLVGAGKTNTTFARFLKKQGFRNFTVFNRTPENAKALVDELGAVFCSLDQLTTYNQKTDLMVTCTGSDQPLVRKDLLEKLQSLSKNMIIVDLAIPNDVDTKASRALGITHFRIEDLQKDADRNLKEREREIVKATAIIEQCLHEYEQLIHEREVEIAMKDIPKAVRKIKNKAIKEVFADDLEMLDTTSLEVIDRLVNYMEKKYISIPMKMAKQVLVKRHKSS